MVSRQPPDQEVWDLGCFHRDPLSHLMRASFGPRRQTSLTAWSQFAGARWAGCCCRRERDPTLAPMKREMKVLWKSRRNAAGHHPEMLVYRSSALDCLDRHPRMLPANQRAIKPAVIDVHRQHSPLHWCRFPTTWPQVSLADVMVARRSQKPSYTKRNRDEKAAGAAQWLEVEL